MERQALDPSGLYRALEGIGEHATTPIPLGSIYQRQSVAKLPCWVTFADPWGALHEYVSNPAGVNTQSRR